MKHPRLGFVTSIAVLAIALPAAADAPVSESRRAETHAAALRELHGAHLP